MMEVDLKFHTEIKHEQIEMFSLREKRGQITFKEYNTNTNMFSKCFFV